MATTIPDPITGVLIALRDNAVAELIKADRPVCKFPLVWKAGYPPADACDCTCLDGKGTGQGWARLVNAASSQAGTSGNQIPTCTSLLLDVTVELGIYRCAPTPPERDTAIPHSVEEEHARFRLGDAALLRRAALCSSWLTARDVYPLIQREQTIGPEGGCDGVAIQLLVRIDDCGCPPP